MIEIEFSPDLSHCIQTLAKNEFDRLARQLLEEGAENAELGVRLEVIKGFLESTDFNKLRSEYEPYLVQGSTVMFRLYQEGDRTQYKMEIT